MKKKGLIAIMLAATIGFFTGILTAPDKGDVTKKKLQRKAEELKLNVEKGYNQTVDNVKNKVDDAKKHIHQEEEKKEDKEKDFIQDAKKEISNILDKIEEKAKETKEKLNEDKDSTRI